MGAIIKMHELSMLIELEEEFGHSFLITRYQKLILDMHDFLAQCVCLGRVGRADEVFRPLNRIHSV